MPATLLCSFYGMNVTLPFAEIKLAWVGIFALMLLAVGFVLILLKKKKML